MTELQERQKKECIARMRMLKLMPNVIKEFENDGTIYYSERQNAIFNATLYWLKNEPSFVDIIKKFEKKHQAMVYHCQLTHLIYGDQLSIFYVSNNENEWSQDRQDIKDNIAFVRVENINDTMFSEFGTIGIKPSMGGILRTA